MVLVVGLFLVVAAVAGLAIDGTRAWIARRTLQTTADAAALAGASALDTGAYRDAGEVALDPVAAEVDSSRLARAGRPSADVQVDAGPDRVTVVLREAIPTTFLALVGVEEMQVAVEAVAAPVPGSLP